MHDASEAYWKDMPRPIKRRPEMRWYRDEELNCLSRIIGWCGLEWPEPAPIKAADDLICLLEKVEFNDSSAERLLAEPLWDDELFLEFFNIYDLHPAEAEEAFIRCFRELNDLQLH
jgi:hypothetical protein